LEGKALVPVCVAIEVDIRMAQEKVAADKLNGHEEEECEEARTEESGTREGAPPALP